MSLPRVERTYQPDLERAARALLVLLMKKAAVGETAGEEVNRTAQSDAPAATGATAGNPHTANERSRT